MMILPQLSLQASDLKRITSSRKVNHTDILRDLSNAGLVHQIDLDHTAIQSNLPDLYQSNAFKQVSSRLGNPDALTSPSITPVTQIYNTTQFPLETNINTMTSNIVSALMDDKNEMEQAAHHRVMYLVLIGIFMFISLLITMVVVVMCKKKNSVFMLQKCEQESDLELDEIEEINTENDTSESEYEQLDSTTDKKRSESYPCLGKLKYMDERLSESETSQKSADLVISKKGRKKLTSASPSSTPLLVNSGAGSKDLSQETISDSNISENSLDKVTGSLVSEKHILCLDKFSIHSQGTDADFKNWRSVDKIGNSNTQRKLVKSKTFDSSSKNKSNLHHQELSTKKGKHPRKSNQKQFKLGTNTSKSKDRTQIKQQPFQYLTAKCSDMETEENTIVLDQSTVNSVNQFCVSKASSSLINSLDYSGLQTGTQSIQDSADLSSTHSQMNKF